MQRIKIFNDVHIRALLKIRNRQIWVTTIRDVFFVTFEK